MAYADELIEEYKKEESTPSETSETTETEVTEPEAATETETDTGTEQTETVTETETPKDPEPTEDKPPEEPTKKDPKDLSKFSKEEKAEYAFQRQLAKQKAKYESSVEDIKKSFQTQIDEIKQSIVAKKAEEPVKTRDQFDSDDEYINYLTMLGVDKRLSERDAQEAKLAKEREESERKKQEVETQQRELASRFESNCRAVFDDQEFKAFEHTVSVGMKNGLGELLDEAPAVREYVFNNPNGPRVLNAMLTNKDSFIRIMSCASNPYDVTLEMRDLAKELASASQPTTQPVQQPMPHIGKPGSRPGAVRSDYFASDDSILDFVRKRR